VKVTGDGCGTAKLLKAGPTLAQKGCCGIGFKILPQIGSHDPDVCIHTRTRLGIRPNNRAGCIEAYTRGGGSEDQRISAGGVPAPPPPPLLSWARGAASTAPIWSLLTGDRWTCTTELL